MTNLPVSLWEANLRQRLQGNDRAAFESVTRSHYARVYRQLWCLSGGDETLCANLTQETFVTAWQSLETFDGRAAIDTWLHTVAFRVWLHAVREKKRHVPQTPLVAALADLPDSHATDPAQHAASRATRAALEAATATLPPAHRRVVRLFYHGEMRHREVALAENIAEGTAKSREGFAVYLPVARGRPIVWKSMPGLTSAPLS